jgi:hypothetical protein
MRIERIWADYGTQIGLIELIVTILSYEHPQPFTIHYSSFIILSCTKQQAWARLRPVAYAGVPKM